MCEVRVDGIKNANWLLDRLGRSFVFKTSEPIDEEVDSPCCTFRVMYGSQMSRGVLERLLAAMPQVSLVAVPA
jgi:hypothetical protein